jgi:hypothetical protein
MEKSKAHAVTGVFTDAWAFGEDDVRSLTTGTEQFMEQAKKEECGGPLPNKDAPIASACQEQCC